MNQTQLRGFDSAQSVYSFIADQIAASNVQLITKRKHRQALLKRLTTVVTTVALVISVNLSEFKAQAQDIQVVEQPANQPVLDTQVRLDTNNYSLLVIEEAQVEIKPGKSRAQVEAEAARAREAAKKMAVTNRPAAPTSAGTVKVSIEEARRMVKEAAAKAGIPDQWKYLEAVWQVETGKLAYGCLVSKADGRAMGPMQFMPGTFRAYKPHANADICNATDALHAAANLLKRGGIASGNVDGAIFNYNHSMAYVNKVKSIAHSIP